ncbi:MAG TPA: hypothetical protein DCP47_01430 [Phycisphaerales bacterium]|nr:hypothetical protein [Phycisphaerales bacterium]
MKTYKAIWTYGQQCRRAGEVFAECEANSLPEFAKSLCDTYGLNLGDGFSFQKFDSEKEVKDCYGDDLPEWFENVTAYPVFVFSSNFGTEILCNPSSSAIINQVRGESYGDYDLTIKGI